MTTRKHCWNCNIQPVGFITSESGAEYCGHCYAQQPPEDDAVTVAPGVATEARGKLDEHCPYKVCEGITPNSQG